MRVSELMQPEVWQPSPAESLADAAIRMRDHGVGSLAVTDGDELIGILTERDLLWAIADGAPPNVTRVGAYMSAPPVVASPARPSGGRPTGTPSRRAARWSSRTSGTCRSWTPASWWGWSRRATC